jgi:hypothetical protein
MRPFLPLLVLTFAAIPATPAPKLKDKGPAPIVGRWVVEKILTGDRDITESNLELSHTYTADGVWVCSNGSDMVGRYRVDGQTIDIDNGRGQDLPGRFRIDGDRLTICLRVVGWERPADFEAGEHINLMVMRRAPAK